MLSHQRKRLDVEDEPLGRTLGPELGVAFGRKRVVGRIDFDGFELLGVELEAVFRGFGPRRIKRALFDQRRIGPRRGTDQEFRSGHIPILSARITTKTHIPMTRCQACFGDERF